jgi:hypothetical protein
MNLNKARDFYSAYYEQSLDEGLRQAFERAMAQDAQVSAEYRQFVRIMEELKALDVPVAVPSDLHAKIRSKVDAHINGLESKSKAPSWFFGWKPIAYGAMASVLIIAGLISLSNKGSKSIATAGMGPVAEASPKLTVESGVLTLRFATARANGVTVTDVAEGRSLFSQQLSGQQLVTPIENSSEDAVLVSIQFSSQYDPLVVAVPGSELGTEQEGSGTLADMALALAERYAAPIVIPAGSANLKVDWQFVGTDALVAAKDELDKLGLKSEIGSGGLVLVTAN